LLKNSFELPDFIISEPDLKGSKDKNATKTPNHEISQCIGIK